MMFEVEMVPVLATKENLSFFFFFFFFCVWIPSIKISVGLQHSWLEKRLLTLPCSTCSTYEWECVCYLPGYLPITLQLHENGSHSLAAQLRPKKGDGVTGTGALLGWVDSEYPLHSAHYLIST